MKTKQRRITTLLALPIFSITLSACNGSQPKAQAQPTPIPTPESSEARAARLESDSQLDTDTMSAREPARRAALEFVRKEYPQAKVKGIHSYESYSYQYRVTVDLEQDGRTRSIELLARQFFPVDGEPYWKADLIDAPLATLVHGAEDTRRHNDLKDERYRNEENRREAKSEEY